MFFEPQFLYLMLGEGIFILNFLVKLRVFIKNTQPIVGAQLNA